METARPCPSIVKFRRRLDCQMATVTQRPVRIAIAKDGLTAHLITANGDPAQVTSENIISTLREDGLHVDEKVRERVDQIEQIARSGQLPGEPVLLVEGQPASKGSRATFELSADLLPDSQSDPRNSYQRTDFYRSQILTVPAGQVIGRLVPAVAPAPGMDVFGRPIPPPPCGRSVQLGLNVELAEDRTTVVAKVAGKVHLTSYQIAIVPVVEIAEDVDFSTGNVDASTDVLINGTIRDAFRVKSSASITVRGAIEAAEVHAGTDIQVNGGVASHGQGCLRANGEVFTKFCNEARVEAGGNITIIREAVNSNLRTTGQLFITQGKLLGGRAYARNGAVVNQAGNEANVRTVIAVGVDPLAIAGTACEDEQINTKLQTIDKIRQSVKPLMDHLKRLTPVQRERATELLCQADAMEQEVREQEQKKAEALQQGGADEAEVAVTIGKIVHPGVIVVIGNRMTPLHKARKGPFKIVRRVYNRIEELLLIDKISGSVSVLPSREYTAEAAAADFEV